MIARPGACRAYSVSRPGHGSVRALSPTASTIAPRSPPGRLRREPLQHALDLPEREHLGTTSVTTASLVVLELVEQLAHVLAAEQLGGMLRIVSVRWVTISDSTSTTVYPSPSASRAPSCDPDRWVARRRVRSSGSPGGLPAASPGSSASRWPAMIRPRATSEPRTLITTHANRIDLVVDPHRRNHHPELAGDLSAGSSC